MKVLHTSDWHLGRLLYGQKRYREFTQFLDWLSQTMASEQIDILLVAGDIFDTSAPSNRAQSLYYEFLCRVATSSCRHIIVIAGNHDSPTFLDAPKALLRSLDVHVIGAATENIDDEILLLKDADGCPELLVCAVPYLRDRDIRQVQAGESLADKDHNLLEGIRNHYHQVAELAAQQRQALGLDIPIIAMGHLFTAGGQTIDGDGVRELYVGSLAHVNASIFPACIDYVALGHLHVPQKIGGSELMRYSGSPLAMGFGEATQQKSVCLIAFNKVHTSPPSVELLNVPVFQRLLKISGNWADISSQLVALVEFSETVWLEIVYQGDELISDLRERLENLTADSELLILRIQNARLIERVLNSTQTDESLEDLDVDDVFDRCLSAHDISATQRPDLLHTYQQALISLHNDDLLAE
ncbi:MAG: exonuclease SbcCD subunit D C-terminal domain-containing protein [Gammaproteobacteria bacterium]|nr:exonuclease SbcCD subunit D C-terminal domain-containing protein [Gammaproteobacteria bacterium]MBQ0838360.1 exonuclease SbcCD subunit D C-terminal domain-containing protein [Gammaproteobacteria bacterium]